LSITLRITKNNTKNRCDLRVKNGDTCRCELVLGPKRRLANPHGNSVDSHDEISALALRHRRQLNHDCSKVPKVTNIRDFSWPG
jgi:hypothetical protein